MKFSFPTRAVFSTAAVTLVCLLSFGSTAVVYAVRNGELTDDLRTTVMLSADPYPVSIPGLPTQITAIPKGSVFSYQEPRCFLSAGHVVKNRGEWIFQGKDKLDPTGTWQRVNAAQYIEEYDSYNDLGVLWVENATAPGSDGLPRIPLGKYAPMPIGRSEIPTGTHAQVIGYGIDSELKPGGGSGYKRKGVVNVSSHNKNATGGYYHVHPLTDGSVEQLPLQGDSGSPLIVGGKSYGVSARLFNFNSDEPTTNENATDSHYTSFLTDENYEWVRRNAALTCGKSLFVSIYGQGTVIGGLQNHTEWFTDWKEPFINGKIDCSSTDVLALDCSEKMHGYGPETMVLTASTDVPGWKFSHFETLFSNTGTLQDPNLPKQEEICIFNPLNPQTCIVNYGAIGMYGPGFSMDSGHVRAVFEQEDSSSSSSSGGANSSSTSSSSTGSPSPSLPGFPSVY